MRKKREEEAAISENGVSLKSSSLQLPTSKFAPQSSINDGGEEEIAFISEDNQRAIQFDKARGKSAKLNGM